MEPFQRRTTISCQEGFVNERMRKLWSWFRIRKEDVVVSNRIGSGGTFDRQFGCELLNRGVPRELWRKRTLGNLSITKGKRQLY